LTTVVATDKDKGKNGDIIYSFLNETKSNELPFDIKRDTGKIYVVDDNKLDHEKIQTYSVSKL